MAVNLEKVTLNNNDYRKVIHTSKFLQVVLMSLKPDEFIDFEIHNDHDQFFRIESGVCKITIEENIYKLTDGDFIVIVAGKNHKVENIGKSDLKLYTIYSPPNHPHNFVQHVQHVQHVNPDIDYKHKYLKYKSKYLSNKK